MSTLYRCYDKDNKLLYIGVTRSIGCRIKEHSQRAKWWSQVACIRLEYFELFKEAEKAERKAILSEDPIHNISRGITNKYIVKHDGIRPRRVSKQSFIL